MSLILDALKRAERERRTDPAPGVEVPTLAAPKRRRLWVRIVLGILALFVLLVVVAVAARVLRGQHAPAPPPAASARPAQPRGAQPPMPAPSPQTGNLVARPAPPSPAARPIPGTESVSTLDELAEPEPAPPPVAMPTAPPARTPPPAPATAPQKQSQGQQSEPPGQGAAAEAANSPAPAASMPETERDVPAALSQPAPLRKFREMPPEFRADFPPLNVQVHVYEKEPSARFVIVNDRRYREGENLAEGPRIVEIARDGIVLEFRGEKLLYTLGR